MTSCERAPARPPPGGVQGLSALVFRRLTSSFVDNVAASFLAMRSEAWLNRPADLAISLSTRAFELWNGNVVWAITSFTRQPSHRLGASHCSSARPARSSAWSRRSAAIAALMSSVMVVTTFRPTKTHRSA